MRYKNYVIGYSYCKSFPSVWKLNSARVLAKHLFIEIDLRKSSSEQRRRRLYRFATEWFDYGTGRSVAGIIKFSSARTFWKFLFFFSYAQDFNEIQWWIL